jgi:hypothetical protein
MKYITCIAIIFIFIFYSCAPLDYIKSSPNIPLFDTVNQLNTTFKFGSLIEYQGSYSITNTLGVFGGINLGNIIHKNRNYFYEGGISLTKQSKVDFINLCIGSSFGKRSRSWKFGLYPVYDIVDVDFKYSSFFIQPSVGFINSKKGRKTFLTLKIDRLHYLKYKNIIGELDQSGDESTEYEIDIDLENVNILRTGIYLTTQKSRKNFNTQLQIGYSFPLISNISENNSNITNIRGLIFRAGVIIPIGKKK